MIIHDYRCEVMSSTETAPCPEQSALKSPKSSFPTEDELRVCNKNNYTRQKGYCDVCKAVLVKNKIHKWIFSLKLVAAAKLFFRSTKRQQTVSLMERK